MGGRLTREHNGSWRKKQRIAKISAGNATHFASADSVCARREREKKRKESSFRWRDAFFGAPAKDKLLLLKAAETFRVLRRDAGSRGGRGARGAHFLEH